MNTDPKTRDAVEYLAAKGLVKVTHANGGNIVFYHVYPESIAYLQDQSDHAREKWTDRIAGFIAGVATSVLSYFIIQAIQASIG